MPVFIEDKLPANFPPARTIASCLRRFYAASLLLLVWLASVGMAQAATVVQVVAGYRHTVAVKTDGTLMGWGNGSAGQLASAVALPYTPRQVLFPLQPPSATLNGQITTQGTLGNLTLTASITPDPAFTQGRIFVRALLPNGSLFSFTPSGWKPFDLSNPESIGNNLSPLTVTLLTNFDATALRGTVVYSGYGLGATDSAGWAEMLSNERYKVAATLQ